MSPIIYQNTIYLLLLIFIFLGFLQEDWID